MTDRLGWCGGFEPLPALGILHHPFDELVLIPDDERLSRSTPRDVIVEQFAR